MTQPRAAGADPLRRFSNRVEDYVRYRPGYPPALIELLAKKTGLGAGSVVADVGSGTGIFVRLLLEAGAQVFAVEPNQAMRAAAEAATGGRPGFFSLEGTAEATGLDDHSVSLVTCAQAFHWFDPDRTRREFIRILVPGGGCALVWNTALPANSAFAAGYERIKSEFGTDFSRVRHENIPRERFAAFFAPGSWNRHAFENSQVLDLLGLVGRMRSSSYAPKEDSPRYPSMLTALQGLFDRCQKNGVVRMEYETEVFLGRFE